MPFITFNESGDFVDEAEVEPEVFMGKLTMDLKVGVWGETSKRSFSRFPTFGTSSRFPTLRFKI
jgi:hypothetical protein